MPAIPRLRLLLPMLVLIGLAGCAIHQPVVENAVSIGPYPAFSGRLIVMQPTRRWQVEIDWKALSATDGWLRLTHAASNRIIELTWHGNALHLTDNKDPMHPNRTITEADLATHGIVIPPRQLATILLGHMPSRFRSTGPDRWKARIGKDTIRITWNAGMRRLTMLDLTRGTSAILLIGTQ